MQKTSLSLDVPAITGSVSAELIMPEKPKCILVLAHGAGAGMHHDFMVSLAEALAEKRIATLRFNFPFIENKKRRPDSPAVAHKTIETAIEKALAIAPELPLVISGKSFGGRMSSQYLSANNNPAVKGIIFYGFPLHPPGKPSIDRAEHLKQVQQPMLFLQGTRDELAKWDLIEPVCSSLAHATLVKIEGADHSFKAGKQNIIAVLAEATDEWLENILGEKK